MKNLILISTLIFTFNLYANEDLEFSVLNALYENLYQKPLNLNPKDERASSPVDGNKQMDRKQGVVEKEEKTTPQQELSKGESYVQQILKKNREALKRRKREQNEDEDNTGDIYKLANRKMKKLAKSVQKTRKAQAKMVRHTYKRWAEAEKRFLKNLPAYKKALVKVETFSPPKIQKIPLSVNSVKKKLSLKKVEQKPYYIIPNALSFPTRDQGRRPTCFAFAGVRGIETKLAVDGDFYDLSEQYFYFKSKPRCQSSPCTERGGWILPLAEKYPQKIPFERDCPYNKKAISGNETQIPLTSNCLYGKVNISKYAHVESMSDLRYEISNNNPVVAGVKLSPNFYRNKGFINYKDRNLKAKMDSHSQGHAILIVGHIKHPKEIKGEGEYCYITANSWGEGWGRGGFSCLSEKWLKSHIIKDALVSIQQVEVL